MAYFMLNETATGRPISLSSVEADPIRPEHTSLDIGTKPSPDTMWDMATASYIPRPPKVFVDRLDDFKSRPGMNGLFTALNPPQQQIIEDAFIFILGSERFRGENNSEAIE